MTPLPPLTPNAWLRWDLVSRLLPENAYAVLEIGCGQGGFGVRLSRMYRYVGLEPDPESFRIASERMAACGVMGRCATATCQRSSPPRPSIWCARSR